MHVRAVLTALVAAGVTTVIAGCGGAPQGNGGSAGSGGSTAAGPISGVVLQTDSAHPDGGTATAGVAVGLYLRPIHAGGPIAADPPQPIATTRTDASGDFRFTGLRAGRRYFVFAKGAKGYSTGRWAHPGDHVRLVACSDCAMPL